MRNDFKPIPGYEGHYEINSEGVVVSVKFNKRLIKKPQFNNHGYPTVCLQIKKEQRRFLIHRLVWMSHVGPIPEGMMVLHDEGNDPSNCRLEYLSVGTYQDNLIRDRIRDGRFIRGSQSKTSKLTEVQVSYIKSRLRDNVTARSLSKMFGVSENVLSRIRNGTIWVHVS